MDKKEKTPPEGFRLNRFIAQSGFCSRRKADEYIALGMVSVNGVIQKKMGIRVSSSDQITVGGERLKTQVFKYFLLNKPKGFLSTCSDPKSRKTVLDFFRHIPLSIHPVGRLDRQTTGLLLLTNDGEFTDRLSHPSYEVPKLYHVLLNKPLKGNDLLEIKKGLELKDGFIKVDEINYVLGKKNEIGLRIHSGKNRIVRRIFEKIGYQVEKLDRVMIGSLTKKNLPRGCYRELNEEEILKLKFYKTPTNPSKKLPQIVKKKFSRSNKSTDL